MTSPMTCWLCEEPVIPQTARVVTIHVQGKPGSMIEDVAVEFPAIFCAPCIEKATAADLIRPQEGSAQ